MIRFLLMLIPIFVVVFGVLNVIVGVLGRSQPPNLVLAGFTEGCEDESRPCWYGIVPRVATVEETNIILTSLGFQFLEKKPRDRNTWVSSYSSEIHGCFVEMFTTIEITVLDRLKFDCENIFLGNFISIFGTPEIFYLQGWSFENEKLLIGMKFSPQDKHKCLDTMPTGEITYFSINSKPSLIHPNHDYQKSEENSSWHGFIPYRKYVELYDFPSCEILNMLP